MNPSTPQFGSNPLPPLKVGESRNGVTVKPGFDSPGYKAPKATGTSWTTTQTGPFGPDRMFQQPLPINSSKGGAGDSEYARGKGKTGAGSTIDLPPSGRPKPGQGIKVTGTDGKPTVIGGPKGALGGSGMRGPINFGGGGGLMGLGKIK
jgi:hypothetical protein